MIRFSLILLSFVLAASSPARAHDVQWVQPPPSGPPLLVQPAPCGVPYCAVPQPYSYRRPGNRSILAFGMRGTLSGALVGLGASYFTAQASDDRARSVGLSVSIGALSGAALGLSLGVFDHMDFTGAYYVSRDLSYGVLFGALIGAIGGGVAAIGGGDEEDVLVGAAAGSLAGLGLGLLTGVIEGSYRARHRDWSLGARRLQVRVAQITPDTRAWGARVSGRF